MISSATSHRSKVLSILALLGAIVFAGCNTPRHSALFEPWGWESEAHAREYVRPYKHVVVARIDSHRWGETKPGRLTPRFFSGTVVRTYKGAWKRGQNISFVHYMDAPAPAEWDAKQFSGELMVIFARDYSREQLVLDTGEFLSLRDELTPALDYLYRQKTITPERSSRR